MLEITIKTEPVSIPSLVSSLYFLECAVYYEKYLPTKLIFKNLTNLTNLTNNNIKIGSPPTSLLKNIGLSYLHVIRNTAIVSGDFDFFYNTGSDIFHLIDNDQIHWPILAKGTNDELKVWCVTMFVEYWGEFLNRKDAKDDPQYDTIKSIYNTATGAATKKKNTNIQSKSSNNKKNKK